MSSLPQNAVWFVTGCSSGIGAAICSYAASQKQRVVATARNVSTLDYLADSASTLKLSLDVTSVAARTAALEAAVARFGRIDVLVNNAGYGLTGDTEALSEAEMRTLLETNFWAALYLTREAVRIFREVNPQHGGTVGGTVVQVSSLGGRVGFPGAALYHASKFALEGFTESMSKEVMPQWNIRFMILEPGGTRTEFASSMKDGTRHAAYPDDAPGRQLRAYAANAEVVNSWADPAVVAKTVFEVVGRSDMPLRLVTGGSGFDLVKGLEDARREELERWKEVSQSCVDRRESDSLAFLQK